MNLLLARTRGGERRRFYHYEGSVSVTRLDGERMQDGEGRAEEAEHAKDFEVLSGPWQGKVAVGHVDKTRAAGEGEESILGVHDIYRTGLDRIAAEARPE